jgi:hypothetical protein
MTPCPGTACDCTPRETSWSTDRVRPLVYPSTYQFTARTVSGSLCNIFQAITSLEQTVCQSFFLYSLSRLRSTANTKTPSWVSVSDVPGGGGGRYPSEPRGVWSLTHGFFSVSLVCCDAPLCEQFLGIKPNFRYNTGQVCTEAVLELCRKEIFTDTPTPTRTL